MNDDTLEIRSLNLNSQFRSNGTITNPQFVLQEQLKEIRGVKLKTACIPLSTYTFDSRNNKIYFDENNSGTILTATIPNGIYTSSTISAMLKSALEFVGVETYTVSYSALTNKLTFSSAVNVFKFMAGNFDAYYELGLTNDDLNNPATSITPSEVIDLSGIKTVHIVSNISAIKVIGQNYSILASLNCEESQNDISTYSDDGPDYINTYVGNLSEISLNLYDSRFRKLTLLKDWSITINFLTQ